MFVFPATSSLQYVIGTSPNLWSLLHNPKNVTCSDLVACNAQLYWADSAFVPATTGAYTWVSQGMSSSTESACLKVVGKNGQIIDAPCQEELESICQFSCASGNL